MSITKWLPNELLVEMIQNTPRADQAALCRVSKLFHALTLPVLNGTVVLDDRRYRTHTFSDAFLSSNTPRADQAALCRVSKLLHALTLPVLNGTVVLDDRRYRTHTFSDAFLSSVIDDPGRASFTRSLTLIFRSASYDSTCDLLFQTLESLKALRHLSLKIMNPSEIFLSHLPHLTFPQLSTCHIEISDHKIRVPSVAQFLSRHPTITQLRLWPIQESTHPVSPSEWAASMLPNLQNYQGTSALLPAFSTRNLRSIVAWADPPDHAVVRLLANPELPFAISITTDISADQQDQMQMNLRSLSEHMPFITQLQIQLWDHGVRMNATALHVISRCSLA
ncbi:hypothetical protein FB45DRAFT_1065550 [Roridomyces roridus]|uniref:Uncharacterized protein n=1 Tax=Roridomyces roridus TaxID=1738132 RepID=A0AAD7FCI7_9AGAR|nr:hypothetical protein FB45DRAFT_1065550 [Roridomyces roridus]